MKNQMKPKTFALLVASAFLSAFCLLAGCVFAANKMWGKKKLDSDKPDWKHGIVYEPNSLIVRQQKTDYISQKNISHTGFVIGGSKSGALRPELLNQFTGNNFYNFYMNNGNFRDYSLYTDYILKECPDVESIVLHLSSHESEEFVRVPFIPVQMQTNIFSKLHSLCQFFRENIVNNFLIDLNPQTIFQLFRKRNESKKPTGLNISSPTGERNSENDAFTKSTYEADHEKFYKSVLCYWTDYDDALKNLFSLTDEPPLPACEKNISALEHIKSACEEHGVKLTVVIGPTFIAECYKYASPRYVQYLKDIVSVCGSVWNFSGINDVSMNPYNFHDGGHCWLFAGDKMLETMYAAEPNVSDMDAFGILLSPENVGAFIARQEEKWAALKAEYDRTGTVPLQTEEDESYLGK